MTTLNLNSPFLPPPGSEAPVTPTYRNPMFPISSLSMREQIMYDPQQAGQDRPDLTPMVQDITKFIGPTGSGILGSWTGWLGSRIATALPETFFDSGTAHSEPFEPSAPYVIKALWDENIDVRDYGYLLSSRTRGEFETKLLTVKLGGNEIGGQGNILGKTLGFAGDTGALLSLGIASESLLYAGLGLRGSAAGVAQARTLIDQPYRQLIDVAGEVALVVNATSRAGFAARGALVGLAEEGLIQMANEAINPVNRPDTSDLISGLVLSGGIYGTVAGAFGKQLIAQRYRQHLNQSYRTIRIGQDVEIGVPQNFSFHAASDMDARLIQPGARPVNEMVDEIATEAASEWARIRNMPGPVSAEEAKWLETNPVARVLDQMETMGLDSGRGLSLTTAGVSGPRTASQTRTQLISQTIVDSLYEGTRRNLRGVALERSILGAVEFIMSVGDRTILGNRKRLQFLIRSLQNEIVSAMEDNLSGSALQSRVKERFTKRLRTEERAAMKNFMDDKKSVTKLLRLSNIANERYPLKWSLALRQGQLDQAWQDVFERNRLMDELWDLYDTGWEDTAIRYGLDENLQRSLVVEMVAATRRANVRLTREQFDTMVEEVRRLIANPPTNASGQIDRRLRLARLAEIQNRAVAAAEELPGKSRKLITIPRYVRERLDDLDRRRTAAATRGASAGGGGGGGAGMGGTPGMVDDLSGPGSPPATTVAEAQSQMAASISRLNSLIPSLNALSGRLPFGLQRLFNQSKYLLGPDVHPLLRFFAMNAIFARSVVKNAAGTVMAQKQTVVEWGSNILNGFLTVSLTSLRNGYVRYAFDRAPTDQIQLRDLIKTTFGNAAKRREFNRRVFNAARGQPETNAAVLETAKEMRAVLDQVHELARSLNVPGFDTLVKNFMPRLYNWDRIRRIAARPGGEDAIRRLIREEMEVRPGLRVVVMEDGTEETFQDLDDAALAFAKRLVEIANRADNAPFTVQDQELVDALASLQGPLAAPTARGVRTPRGRARVVLREDAQIQITAGILDDGQTTMSLNDLIHTDLATVMKKYLTSVMGAVNEKRMLDIINDWAARNHIYAPFTEEMRNGDELPQFVRFERFEEYLNFINDQSGGTVTPQQNAALRTLIGAIRFEPMQRGNLENRIANQLGQIPASVLLPLVYMARGGAFALGATAEIGRLAGFVGLRTMVKQLPAMGEMIQNWKNLDTGARNFMSLVDQAFHPATDRLRRVLYRDLPTEVDESATGIARFGKGMESLATYFADVSLLAPITSFSQNLTAASMLQHFYEVARGQVRRFDDATIRTLGIEPEDYDRIAQFVGREGRTNGNGRVIDLVTLAGDDFDRLKTVIDRAVRTRIQDVPTRGDFHDFAFSFFGKLLTQFRTFSLKSVDNFLGQNMSRVSNGDMNASIQVSKEIAAAMMTGGLIAYARNMMAYEDAQRRKDKKRMEQVEKRLGLGGFLRGAMDYTGEFFLPLMGLDSMWRLGGKPIAKGMGFEEEDYENAMLDPHGFGGMGFMGFPVADYVKNSYNIVRDVLEGDVNRRTVRNMFFLTPGANLPGFSQFFGITEDMFVEEFNLPERRGTRD